MNLIDVECIVCGANFLATEMIEDVECPDCKFNKFFWDEDSHGNIFLDCKIEDIREFKKTYKEKIVIEKRRW